MIYALYFLGISFSAILIGWSCVAGQDIPFSSQWPLYEALRTTASIIFAVVGAWLAIIYPERLKFAFHGKGQNAIQKNSGMGRLLSPAIHSTAILCIVLLIGIIAPLLSRVGFLHTWKPELRGASYGLLVILTLWQLGTIVLTLIPADRIKHESDKEDLRNQTTKGYFEQTQKSDIDTE